MTRVALILLAIGAGLIAISLVGMVIENTFDRKPPSKSYLSVYCAPRGYYECV